MGGGCSWAHLASRPPSALAGPTGHSGPHSHVPSLQSHGPRPSCPDQPNPFLTGLVTDPWPLIHGDGPPLQPPRWLPRHPHISVFLLQGEGQSLEILVHHSLHMRPPDCELWGVRLVCRVLLAGSAAKMTQRVRGVDEGPRPCRRGMRVRAGVPRGCCRHAPGVPTCTQDLRVCAMYICTPTRVRWCSPVCTLLLAPGGGRSVSPHSPPSPAPSTAAHPAAQPQPQPTGDSPDSRSDAPAARPGLSGAGPGLKVPRVQSRQNRCLPGSSSMKWGESPEPPGRPRPTWREGSSVHHDPLTMTMVVTFQGLALEPAGSPGRGDPGSGPGASLQHPGAGLGKEASQRDGLLPVPTPSQRLAPDREGGRMDRGRPVPGPGLGLTAARPACSTAAAVRSTLSLWPVFCLSHTRLRPRGLCLPSLCLVPSTPRSSCG